MVLREIPSSTHTTNDRCRDSIQHFFAFWEPAGALTRLMRGFVAKLPRQLISIVSWFFTMLCYESVSNFHSWIREHISLLLVAGNVKITSHESAPTVPSVLLHDDKLRVFFCACLQYRHYETTFTNAQQSYSTVVYMWYSTSSAYFYQRLSNWHRNSNFN